MSRSLEEMLGGVIFWSVIDRTLFQTDPREAARALLGTTLSHRGASGRIIETEAYSTVDDAACHTAFRRQARDFVENERAGAAYIYLNYGVYHLLNILTTASDGEKGFVLIRALEPLAGISEMVKRRGTEDPRNLCSGPGKLTIALGIGPENHRLDLCAAESPIQFQPHSLEEPILVGTRIGITKAADYPWRFGIQSRHLSKPFPYRSERPQ